MTLDPPDAAEDAEWFQTISWQGGGLVIDDMRATGTPASTATGGPVPLHGDWKTLVRLHDGNSLTALAGLPARGRGDPGRRRCPPPTARRASSSPTTRSSSASSSPPRPRLWAVAYGVVLAITLLFLALIAWGLHRLAVTAEGLGQRGEAKRSERAPGRIGGPIGASR